MARISRRAVVAAAASAFATVSIRRYSAGAAEYTFKVGINTPTTHPQTISFFEAAHNILSDSNGRLELKIFPNSVLGNEVAMLEQVRSGAIEMFNGGDRLYASIAPAAGIDSMPFVFPEAKDADAAIDGPLGAYIRKTIAATGLYPLSRVWNLGLKQITATREINVPDDLKGLKIATTSTAMQFSFIRGLSATPIALGLVEIYPALASHLADGCEQTLASVLNSKFYEVAKFSAITNHQWVGYTTTVNGDAWRNLPDALRTILERDVNAAALKNRIAEMRTDLDYPEKLKAQGMTINHVKPALFQSALRSAGFYTEWRDKFPPEAWALLEKSIGKKLA